MSNPLVEKIEHAIAEYEADETPTGEDGAYEEGILWGLHTALRLVNSIPQVIIVEMDGIGGLAEVYSSIPARVVIIEPEMGEDDQEAMDATLLSKELVDNQLAPLPEWEWAHALLPIYYQERFPLEEES